MRQAALGLTLLALGLVPLMVAAGCGDDSAVDDSNNNVRFCCGNGRVEGPEGRGGADLHDSRVKARVEEVVLARFRHLLATVEKTLVQSTWNRFLAMLPQPRAKVRRHRLPRNRDLAFYRERGTGSDYLLLRKNGEYHQFSREHMFLAVTDSGRWHQANSGELLLCSGYNFRPVWYDDLSVSLESAREYANLRTLQQRIRAALRIKRNSYPAKSFAGLKCDDARIRRADLAGFLKALERYLRSGAPNLYHVALRSYGKHRFAVPYEEGSWADVTDAEATQQLDEFNRKGFYPRFIHLEIPIATFHQHMRTTHPFLFYRSLNAGAQARTRHVLDFRQMRLARPRCGRHFRSRQPHVSG